jgi:hypothetical protein
MATPTNSSIDATDHYKLPHNAPELLYRIQQLVFDGKEGDLKELFKFYGFDGNSLKMNKQMENLYNVFEKINKVFPLEKWYIDYYAYEDNQFIAYIKIGAYEQTFQFEYDETTDEYTVYDSDPKFRARMKLWTVGSLELYSRFYLHMKDVEATGFAGF